MIKINQNPDPHQIQEKLIEKLEKNGWSELLKGYLRSSDFERVIEFLISENKDGRKFTPALKQIFKGFEETPLDKTKVVMIGDGPYYQPFMSDGILYSCSNTVRMELHLKFILNAIQTSVSIDDIDLVEDAFKQDLRRWSQQGILMLNSDLTTEVDKPHKHSKLWSSFNEYLIDMLNWKYSGLIWVLIGKRAQAYESSIGEHHTIIKCSHPPDEYMSLDQWDFNDIFNKVNKQLVEYKKEKIKW